MKQMRLGQHFLKNKSAIKRIVAGLDFYPGDTILEIGAGHGELTTELRVTNSELKIIAAEKDGELVNLLRVKFAQDKNMEIIEGDILKILPDIAGALGRKIENYKIVGNIPYYITGKLLRIVGELENKPSICVLTLQKEVAERIAAAPPKMNRLAASIQFWAKPEILERLSRKDFEPAPEVESAILKLATSDKRQATSGAEKYYRTVKILFQQPRKTILNNLMAGEKHLSAKKDDLAEKLRKIGVNPKNRPQNLSVNNILEISRHLSRW